MQMIAVVMTNAREKLKVAVKLPSHLNLCATSLTSNKDASVDY